VSVVTIPYAPRAAMVPFHERTQRDANLICHRRFGKTVGICNDGQKRALTKSFEGREHAPPRFAWMYPTRVRAKDIAWGYLKYYSRTIPGAYPIESELAIQYPNGARFTLYGADNRRGVGLYLDGIYYDEDDEISPQVHADIAPTLSDYGGFEVHAGMLKGGHNLWKRHERMRGDPNVFNMVIRASESGILPAAELARLRVSMGDSAYEMQMECNPHASMANAIYGRQMEQMRKESRITKLRIVPDLPAYVFFDIGHSMEGDDWSMWFVQLDGRDVLCHRYYARTGELPAHYANVIFSMEEELKCRVHTVFLPHDGTRLDRHGVSAKDDLESAGLRGRVKTVIRTPKLWDSINDVRAFLARVFIDQEGCGQPWTLGENEMPSGIDCLDFYTKKIETQTGMITEIPVHNQYSHGADAFRTMVEAYKNGLIAGGGSYYEKQATRVMVSREPNKRQILVRR